MHSAFTPTLCHDQLEIIILDIPAPVYRMSGNSALNARQTSNLGLLSREHNVDFSPAGLVPPAAREKKKPLVIITAGTKFLGCHNDSLIVPRIIHIHCNQTAYVHQIIHIHCNQNASCRKFFLVYLLKSTYPDTRKSFLGNNCFVQKTSLLPGSTTSIRQSRNRKHSTDIIMRTNQGIVIIM